MKKILLQSLYIAAAAMMVFCAMSGCSDSKAAQTGGEDTQTGTEYGTEETATQQGDSSVSVAVGGGVDLPSGYPSDKFPLYGGCYILSVLELNGGYTLTAYSKDAADKVVAFYDSVLKGATVTSETRDDIGLVSFGQKDGYTYNIAIADSQEMEGYSTAIYISLQP